jgi:hypothetical protein
MPLMTEATDPTIHCHGKAAQYSSHTITTKNGKASATYATARSCVTLPMAMVKYPEAKMHF